MCKKILVIGYGNPLRGDDAIGGLVLEKLAELVSPKQNIVLIYRHQLDVVDAEAIADSKAVIFVDAHVDEQLEEIHVVTLAPRYKAVSSTAHISSPEELLCLTQHLFDSAPQAYICAVRGYDFSLGAQVTERARLLTHKAALKVADLLNVLER